MWVNGADKRKPSGLICCYTNDNVRKDEHDLSPYEKTHRRVQLMPESGYCKEYSCWCEDKLLDTNKIVIWPTSPYKEFKIYLQNQLKTCFWPLTNTNE